jgi:ABC-type branched-subunit amino acid transport system substrate-binding protein
MITVNEINQLRDAVRSYYESTKIRVGNLTPVQEKQYTNCKAIVAKLASQQKQIMFYGGLDVLVKKAINTTYMQQTELDLFAENTLNNFTTETK